MPRRFQKLKKFKLPFLIFTFLIFFCFFMQQFSVLPHRQPPISRPPPNSLYTCITYDGVIGNITDDPNVIDNILIINDADITIRNSTIQGNIYVFNTAVVYLLQNSNVTNDIIISDETRLFVQNSTIGGKIQCSDSSILNLSACNTPTTTILKSDFANITISNSSIFQFNEFGGLIDSGGQTYILNSQIGLLMLTGVSLSRIYINNSIILSPLQDYAFPFLFITGPFGFNFNTYEYVPYSTSEREVNVTWYGWDSPIINGYQNLTFQILLDGQFYAEVNGSGFLDQYSGHYLININTTGMHTISVIAIDGAGNNITLSIDVEIIEYPTFPWLVFGLIVISIIVIIAAVTLYLRSRQKRGYHSSLGNIFKKELSENKIKIIIFIAVAAVPGIILFLIFNLISRQGDVISIDGIRGLVNMIFTLFLFYFGMAFSIAFGASAVVNAKKDGSLSWFLSKPVRRWEFLWGKIFAYLFVIILIMIASSISFIICGISFIDPIYIPDLFSMGGFIFLIGLTALIPLTALVVLFSTVFKKPGLAIFIPIMLLIVIPPIVSFLPLAVKHEWPLLFSFSYYYEQLGSAWVYEGGGFLGMIGSSYGALVGVTITPLELTTTHVILILSVITIVSLILSTYYIQKQDIP